MRSYFFIFFRTFSYYLNLAPESCVLDKRNLFYLELFAIPMPPTSNIDKAFDVVKTGPVLPVEVASKLGVDSFLANAYLSQLVDTGKIKQSTERVGNSFVYFLAGQEGAATTRI